nr:MAG TPA: hypothetical protein [Caudoviricetes sp.]
MKLRDFLLSEFNKHKEDDIYLSVNVLGAVDRKNRTDITIIPYATSLTGLINELFKMRDDGLIELYDTLNMGYIIALK